MARLVDCIESTTDQATSAVANGMFAIPEKVLNCGRVYFCFLCVACALFLVSYVVLSAHPSASSY